MTSSEARPQLVLLGCLLMTAGFGAFLLGPASIVPLLIDSFGINKASAGLAISAGYLGWLLFQLPSGFLLDRFDNRRLVFGASAVLFGSSALGVFAAEVSYPVLLATRFVGGTAGGFLFAGNANIVGRVFPAERRGFATSLYVASGPIGMATGQATSPIIADAVGWPAAFVAYGVVSLIGYLVLHLAARESIRAGDATGFRAFVRALGDRGVLLVSFTAFCSNALFLFLNSWMPTYAAEVLAIPLAGAGVLGALVPIAGIFGRPSGGWISDRIGRRRRPVLLFGLAVSLPLLGVVPFTRSVLVFGGVLLVAGFVLQLTVGVQYVLVQELADPAVSGTSLAVLTAFGAGGAFGTPPLGGWLIETFSWAVAFGVVGVIGIAGVAAVLLVREP